MTYTSKLRELLARVESATEPLIELDREIGGILEAALVNIVEPPRYTSSIDAAVALCERVLPSLPFISMMKYSDGWYVRISKKSTVMGYEGAQKPLASLALCAAILRAKVAMLEKAKA